MKRMIKGVMVPVAATLAAVWLLAAGCGGDGQAPRFTTINGNAADGYLVGATVCQDRNNNRQCDPGEPATTSTAGGAYSLLVPFVGATLYPVLVEVTAGVVDEGPPQVTVTQPYTLIAPPGHHQFISPLSTLVQHLSEQNGTTVEQAESSLRTQLGLTGSLFDDYLTGGGASPLAAAIAKRVADALATALAAVPAGQSPADALKIALAQVVTQLPAIVQQARDELNPPPPPPPVRYTVTPAAGSNGGIMPDTGQIVDQGGTTSFTITPASGYAIASVSGCNGILSGNTYTTGAITEACTVSASFALIPPPPPSTYIVTPVASGNGAISPATPQTVTQGDTASFSVTPQSGYAIASVSGCNGSLSGSTYTTGVINGACTVTASFSAITHTVTPSAGANGSISPATTQIVNQGSSSSFTITPDSGYEISSVSGCNGTLSGSIYTTGPITGNCAVTASFVYVPPPPPPTYSVTPSAGANGSISPATTQTVSHGTTTSFTVSPNSGYAINTVSGCNGNLSGSSYTTGPVTGNCTVTASFVYVPPPPPPTYSVTPSAGANGSITPATTQTVVQGNSASFTITPASGYAIDTVSGCNGTLSGSTYTTGSITGACTVAATFKSTTGSADFSW